MHRSTRAWRWTTCGARTSRATGLSPTTRLRRSATASNDVMQRSGVNSMWTVPRRKQSHCAWHVFLDGQTFASVQFAQQLNTETHPEWWRDRPDEARQPVQTGANSVLAQARKDEETRTSLTPHSERSFLL